MSRYSKIIPIILFCCLISNKLHAQAIFIQHFNDTSFYKKWKVSQNIEHAKRLNINLTNFARLHPKTIDEYIETPLISITKSNKYALIFDWNIAENLQQDSIQVLMSKNNGATWKILKTLKNINTQFWFRDSVYLSSLSTNDSIIISWQYIAKQTSQTQTFNLDNVQIKMLDAVVDKQAIHEFEVKASYVASKHNIKVECKNLEGKKLQLRMYASKGIVIKNMILPTSKKNKIDIDVSDISKGTYFIEVESNDEIFTQAILVQ